MKTCKDFKYTGVKCCPGCHYENEAEDLQRPLMTIKINGEWAYVCCELAEFFYPDSSWVNASNIGATDD